IQGSHALPYLRRQNPEAYGRFCYKVGIGYFYQMGGAKGKTESEIWFGRALSSGAGLTESQRSRASCYQKIGSYYRSFLVYGRDENSESGSEDYRDFFLTLKQLGSYALEHAGNKEDQSAAWYAACEVAAEIRDYAGDFLGEDEITGSTLLGELEKIEGFPENLSGDRDGEKRKQLMNLVEEAKRRVQIMEAYYEKQKNSGKMAYPSGLPSSDDGSGDGRKGS
ncbi:MAG: hypothetical protein IKX76_00240, partial [Eubacterium sp.]|nr:hypothetical protein [Eubacterium sp.]